MRLCLTTERKEGHRGEFLLAASPAARLAVDTRGWRRHRSQMAVNQRPDVHPAAHQYPLVGQDCRALARYEPQRAAVRPKPA